MTEHRQTQLGIQNIHRTPTKIRHLSPEDLGIPSVEQEEEQDEEGRWESLRETAIETGGSEVGVAIRTEDGTVSTGTSLTKGASQNIHPLELAVWKGYDETESPVVDVAVAIDNLDIPCGRCLQVLQDYSSKDGATIQITDGDTVEEYLTADLLPHLDATPKTDF